jgi:hypothetical protein
VEDLGFSLSLHRRESIECESCARAPAAQLLRIGGTTELSRSSHLRHILRGTSDKRSIDKADGNAQEGCTTPCGHTFDFFDGCTQKHNDVKMTLIDSKTVLSSA